MRERPFQVAVETGTLHGHAVGDGEPPALLLHGGAAVTDYMDACARELDGVLRTIRYQQRGTFPSDTGPPYTIEAHVEDAIAVLDHFGIERTWAVGHSWGAHLALHLAVLHPERLLGIVGVGTLGAVLVFPELDANLRRRLSDEDVARVDEIETRRRAGAATEAELLERWHVMWPTWFVDPEAAPPDPVSHIGASSSAETNASISAHYAAGTLERRLPEVTLRALFVHGELDPLPVRSSSETAALMPHAGVGIIPGCGHFPWLERPGELRRRVQALFAR